METWLRVKARPFGKWYEVSSLGRVRRIPGRDCAGRWRDGGLISLHNTGNYIQAALFVDRKRKFWLVHHLVALTFLGKPPGRYGKGRGKWQINHKNLISTDNRPENLEWVTPSSNQLHGCAANPKRRGAEHHKAKLVEDDVIAIRAAYKKGETLADLGRLYGVTTQNVYRIVNGLTWKHV